MVIQRNKSEPESEPAIVPSDPAPAPPIGNVQVTNQAEPDLFTEPAVDFHTEPEDEEDVPTES